MRTTPSRKQFFTPPLLRELQQGVTATATKNIAFTIILAA
jgi:hypothetical protein